jgi:hypothetical protein
MRRGSLGERFIKYGKARCDCARDERARHGPCEQWADVELAQQKAEEAEKGGSQRSRRSRGEIEAFVSTGAIDDGDLYALETAVHRKAMRVAARAVSCCRC